MVADDPRFPAPNPPQKWLDQQTAIRDENRERKTAELRDAFALAIAPSVVEALSPKGYGQKDWTPAKVIGGTIYARADFIITNPPWGRELLLPMIEKFRIHAPTWLLFDAGFMHNGGASHTSNIAAASSPSGACRGWGTGRAAWMTAAGMSLWTLKRKSNLSHRSRHVHEKRPLRVRVERSAKAKRFLPAHGS